MDPNGATMSRALSPGPAVLSPDASRLSFPLQLVISIVAIVLTIYTSQTAIRSDVRDILTRMELGRDAMKLQSEKQDERTNALKISIDTTATTMKAAIDAISRRQEMQQIQISELKDAINKLSTGRK
jgi:hypothetical protein